MAEPTILHSFNCPRLHPSYTQKLNMQRPMYPLRQHEQLCRFKGPWGITLSSRGLMPSSNSRRDTELRQACPHHASSPPRASEKTKAEPTVSCKTQVAHLQGCDATCRRAERPSEHEVQNVGGSALDICWSRFRKQIMLPLTFIKRLQ